MKFVIFGVLLYGCSLAIDSYPITDRDRKVHYYDKELSKIDADLTKKYFCQNHYRWESVSKIRSKRGIQYIIK
tara:strand:- start:1156 stop:1374 length:219 start_codon:yes stop_codon:yes gene_type:complete